MPGPYSSSHDDSILNQYYDMGYEDAMEFSDRRIEELMNTISKLRERIRSISSQRVEMK